MQQPSSSQPGGPTRGPADSPPLGAASRALCGCFDCLPRSPWRLEASSWFFLRSIFCFGSSSSGTVTLARQHTRESHADMSEQEFAVRVNDQLKSTELRLCGALGRDKRHGAHMRAFWASTVSFFVAFVGWFALSPIAIEVVHSIDACENQLFPPVANPERKAFLKFKAIASGKKYCQYGKIGEDNNPTGCQDVPQDVWDESCGGVAATACTQSETLTDDVDLCPEVCMKYPAACGESRHRAGPACSAALVRGGTGGRTRER